MGVLQLAESLLDSRFLIGRDLFAVVLEEVLGSENHRVGLVELVDALTLLLVVLGVLLSLSLHALDLIIAQTA